MGKALWLLLPTAARSTILLIVILEDYGCIALSVWVPCSVPVELSVCLSTSCLVGPISVATQEIHRGTYIASHVVGHNAPVLYQANNVPPPPEGPFLCTKHLGEIVPDFQRYLTNYCN